MSDIVERLREVAERADANYPAIMEQAADTITNLRAEVERLTADRAYTDDARVDALDWAEQLRAENERLRAALTPSGDTKGAYHGEFYIEEEIIDEEGEPKILRIPVPWTTIKEIMAAIRARAALAEEKSG